jgi:LysR family transcriptional regulator for bpeEF and oprC
MRLIQQITGIEEFIRTAETRSFVRAAESLGLTPSGVSKAVRLLETRLGVRLLHRTTRSVSLTDDGAAFYERTVKWLADLEDIQGGLSVGDADLHGMVRIDMPVTYGRVLFMPFLATFLERYPKVTVDVRMNDRYVDLVAEGVDLAIRIGDLDDSELVVRPLGRVKFGTYMCVRCMQTYGTPEQPADLSSHRLISFVHASGRAKKLQYIRDGQEIDIDATRAVVSFNNGEAMTDAVIAGIGIAQLPVFHAREALDAGLIAQVLNGWDADGPAIQLVYASRKHLSRRVRALIEFIGNELASKT